MGKNVKNFKMDFLTHTTLVVWLYRARLVTTTYKVDIFRVPRCRVPAVVYLPPASSEWTPVEWTDCSAECHISFFSENGFPHSPPARSFY